MVGALGVCVLGLFVLFGAQEVLSPTYPKDRVEGEVVLAVTALPFLFSAFVLWSGLGKLKDARDYDRWISLSASRPDATVDHAAGMFGVPIARWRALGVAGGEGGFVFDVANPELRVLDASAGHAGARALVGKPGQTSLLVALASYGYGALAAVLLLSSDAKIVGRDWVVLVCVVGIPLTFALDVVSVVGGIRGIVEVRRRDPNASIARPAAALVLGVVGFLGVLLLVFATALSMSFGPK